MDIQELQQRARALALGPQFKPRQQTIDTPHMLLEQMPELQDMLKLVGLSANDAMELRQASSDDGTLLTALYVCHCLRFRDDGGPNGTGTPYFAMSDAKALTEQDIDLLNEFGFVVKPFLGIGPKSVEDAKNDSEVTTNSAGGSALPENSDVPSANVSDDLSTANSLNG